MKRILMIANTYYQLIIAIQMRYTIFENEEVILLLSNHSKGAEIACKKLADNNIFSETHYIKTKGIVAKRNYKEKFKDALDIAFKSQNRFSYYLTNIENKYFDEMIFHNFDLDIYGVYATLYQHNPRIAVSQYEEGILSYGVSIDHTLNREAIGLIRKLFRKKTVYDALSKFYCFYPQLYSGALNVCKVPGVQKTGPCANGLRLAFDITDEVLNYPEKYIFFAGIYDFEGGTPIGELDLACKVADLVGKENLLVKIHPRDTRTEFRDYGFRLDANTHIPWEAIQLSGDFQDKVFLTTLSGSALAGSLMMENPVKTFYMFKQCDISGNSTAQRNMEIIQNLLRNSLMQKSFSSIKITERIEEILG